MLKNKSIHNKNLKQTKKSNYILGTLLIGLFLVLSIQNLSQINIISPNIVVQKQTQENNQSTLDKVPKNTPIIGNSSFGSLPPVYAVGNVSQYNVTEAVNMQDLNTAINITTQNQTMSVPSGTIFNGDNFQINNVYNNFDVTQDGNITQGVLLAYGRL